MNIVFASHSPFDECLVVGSHHLARELALAGHTVWHIGPPVTPLHFLKATNRSYRRRLAQSFKTRSTIQQGLTSIAPFSAVPWQIARHLLSKGNMFVHFSNLGSILRKATHSHPIDLLLFDDPRLVGLEKLLKPASVFYRPTDLYSEMKNDPKLISAERQLLSRSDGVIATSHPVLLHALTLKPGLPHVLLENGVDHPHFSRVSPEPEELASIPHPRVLYVGAIDFRFDYSMVNYLAEKFPEVQFVIVGPGDLARLRLLLKANIHVLGPKPYAKIPGFLQHSDVGILPLLDNMTNSGRSPMKLYEYGAAGLPVIARFTQELSRRHESFVHLFRSNEEAVEMLRGLLDQPIDRQAITASCQPHSWATKMSALLTFVDRARFKTSPVARQKASQPAASRTIVMNGRFLDQEMTGVQRYAHGMLERLGPRLRIVRPQAALSPVRGHLWEQTVLPWECRGTLLWSPGNTGPLLTANQVVTIHDASTLDHPEWFSGKFAHWYRFLLPRLTRRARKIITVSEFSKERLIATCSIPASRVAVIPNAIDPRFQPASPQDIDAFRRKHQLERLYFLYVGSLEPRKNLSILLKAWAELSLLDCDLVIAGTPGHVFREKGFAALPPNTRLFGRVDDAELPTLLSAARCFVFPSLYEGFGFPPLEAMACGCPVICSNLTSLPEVCGPAFDDADPASPGAALYFDPHEQEQLVEEIKRVLTMSPSTLERLTRNGKTRAAQFGWDACAAQTWAVLEELVLS